MSLALDISRRRIQGLQQVTGVVVVLAQVTQGDGGDGTVAPGLVQAAKQGTASL